LGCFGGSLLLAFGMSLLLIFVLEHCFQFLVLLLVFLVLLIALLRVLDLLDVLPSCCDWEATDISKAVEEVLLQCDFEPVVKRVVLLISVLRHEMEGEVASDCLSEQHH